MLTDMFSLGQVMGVQGMRVEGREWALGNRSRAKSHSVGSMEFVQPHESSKQTAWLFILAPISVLCPWNHQPHQPSPGSLHDSTMPSSASYMPRTSIPSQ